MLIACKVQAYLKGAHRLADVVIYGGTNGVRLEVIGIKLIVFICARAVKFRSKWQSRGEVCAVIFLDRVWVFAKRSLSRL